ncbi:MAG: hypothetical protein HUU49_00335 [Candidatus Buchananbacteria bacterium]|nr:hypothetical protein [Candidatus Buchananbacteria bacterium]
MTKKIRIVLIFITIVIIVLVTGLAITKLTVFDTVSVDESFRKNVMQAVSTHYDNPFERLALWLGESRIVSATPLSAEVESFTLFRIPLGFLRGMSDMKLGIFFNPAGDWSAKISSSAVGFELEEQESSKQQADDDLWQTVIDDNQGIKFKYPKRLLAQYVFIVEWPPVVMTDASIQELNCQETAPEKSLSARIIRRQVDDRVYCVHAASEGAAGSVYTKYAYSTVWHERLVTVSFVLRYPQCTNYDEPAQTECQNERESFDLDAVVDRIVLSLEV